MFTEDKLNWLYSLARKLTKIGMETTAPSIEVQQVINAAKLSYDNANYNKALAQLEVLRDKQLSGGQLRDVTKLLMDLQIRISK
jgi:hypothetical protein